MSDRLREIRLHVRWERATQVPLLSSPLHICGEDSAVEVERSGGYAMMIRASRVAAILVEIDANDLYKVLACRHYIIFKIGDFLSCSEHAFSLLG